MSLIRPAIAADLPRVWELIQELAEFERLSHAVSGTYEQLEMHLGRFYSCFVCEAEGEVVGYALAFPMYSTFKTRPGLWLEDLFVTPKHRGNGYGKAMLQFLIDMCRSEGFGRLEWSVLDWNVTAIEFYKAMGADVMPDWRICRVAF